jgi:hypothetical protein
MGFTMSRKILLPFALALATLSTMAIAADRDVAVRFKPGTSSAAYDDTIKGYDTVNYYLEAAAGQRLLVDFGPDETSCYFNILAPGDGETLVDGSAIEPDGLVLPDSGKYRVVVYLMRATARRGTACTYAIDFRITD